MKNGFHIFDTHTHIGVARHSGRRCSADELLRHMDGFGVDQAMVIPFPVVEDYKASHDEIGCAVKKHPDRLMGAACIYPFVAEADFRAEVCRCREQYGFRALKLQPQYQALNPLAKSSDFLFESAIENQLTLIAHTGTGIPFALPALFMAPARRFPGLKIILAHTGGGGIFAGEAVVAAMFCSNIYLELSSLMPHQILEVLSHIPANRLMIGSDLPESLATEIGKILDLDIPETDKRSILSQTACEVFAGSC